MMANVSIWCWFLFLPALHVFGFQLTSDEFHSRKAAQCAKSIHKTMRLKRREGYNYHNPVSGLEIPTCVVFFMCTLSAAAGIVLCAWILLDGDYVVDTPSQIPVSSLAFCTVLDTDFNRTMTCSQICQNCNRGMCLRQSLWC